MVQIEKPLPYLNPITPETEILVLYHDHVGHKRKKAYLFNFLTVFFTP